MVQVDDGHIYLSCREFLEKKLYRRIMENKCHRLSPFPDVDHIRRRIIIMVQVDEGHI